MKKLVALVLAISMFVLGSSMVASAAMTELSLNKDDLARGKTAYKLLVYNKDDGTLVADGSNISFPLPTPVAPGQSITATFKGTADGDFRVWLINENENTMSNLLYKMSEHGFTSGEFDVTVTFTNDEKEGKGDVTELFFKAPTYDGKIENLNLTYVAVSEPFVAEAEEVVEEAPAAATTATTSAPKTGVESNAFAYLALMAVATVGFVATKKKVFNK